MSSLTPFANIRAMAEQRKGGAAALKALLLTVRSPSELATLSDDRYLAMMAKAINQAGFNWTVISNKWPEFEEAFFGFDPAKLASLLPEEWEAYSNDRRIVRHGQKIKAVRDNVAFVMREAQDHGSFGHRIAHWPEDDQIGLLAYLKKHGARLGGNTGQWFLRYVGKDCFVTSADVVTMIRHAGYDIAEQPTSKRDMQKVQLAFNNWHQETGLSYTHLSQIAAFSVGENYDNEMIHGEMTKFKAV